MASIPPNISYNYGDLDARERFEKFSERSQKIKDITTTFNPESDLLSADLEVIKKRENRDSLAFRISNFFNPKSDLDYHSEALENLLKFFTEVNQAIVAANGHSYTYNAQSRNLLPQNEEMVILRKKMDALKNRILIDPELADEKKAWETGFNKLDGAMQETQDRLNKAEIAMKNPLKTPKASDDLERMIEATKAETARREAMRKKK